MRISPALFTRHAWAAQNCRDHPCLRIISGRRCQPPIEDGAEGTTVNRQQHSFPGGAGVLPALCSAERMCRAFRPRIIQFLPIRLLRPKVVYPNLRLLLQVVHLFLFVLRKKQLPPERGFEPDLNYFAQGDISKIPRRGAVAVGHSCATTGGRRCGCRSRKGVLPARRSRVLRRAGQNSATELPNYPTIQLCRLMA